MYKHYRYPPIIIKQDVYFKLRFTLSYRDVEELLAIRGIKVDHSTIQRWVFKFSKKIKYNMNQRKKQVTNSWRLNETYIKVSGKDRFLYSSKSQAVEHFIKASFLNEKSKRNYTQAYQTKLKKLKNILNSN